MRVVFIGAGNLATRLSLAMGKAGIEILQVYSHTEAHAKELADKLSCSWTTQEGSITDEADLYIFSLKDDALPHVIAHIKPNKALWVHTAGSVPMNIFEGYAERFGVIYPLQTFSKGREVDFQQIPFFVEANSPADEEVLWNVAITLSNDVCVLSSEKRKSLHLAAVFACNFTNHMYHLAGNLLEEQGIPQTVLLPLIDETAAKVHDLSPAKAQTGPAIRYDKGVIGRHLNMIDDSSLRHIYEILSQSIHTYTQHEQH